MSISIEDPRAVDSMKQLLGTVQARSKTGLLEAEDCQRYMNALARARAFVDQHPELGIVHRDIQLIMSGKSPTGTRTIIHLEHTEGGDFISINRGTGWSEKICRIDVPLLSPFRKLKPKPKEISARGGCYFLDWVWQEESP